MRFDLPLVTLLNKIGFISIAFISNRNDFCARKCEQIQLLRWDPNISGQVALFRLEKIPMCPIDLSPNF